MYTLNSKVVIITGASSGIGEACAFQFAEKGARLVLVARSTDKLIKLADTLKSRGVEVISLTGDVSKEEDCKAIVAKAVEVFGGIDVLINNAGISMRAAFEDVDLKVLRQLMDVNFWGAVYCTKYALPYLLKNKGSITGVSSVAGLHGLPGRTGYSASKYALQGFFDTLRVETLNQGLHVMIAIPGFTASNVRFSALTADGSPQGETPRAEEKMMTSKEVAQRIVRGIEKKKRVLLMTKEGKLTPWLKLLMPSFLDRAYYNHMKKEPDSPIR